MSHNVTEALLVASTAVYINCIIGAVITGTIFVLEFIAILENRKDLNLKNPVKRWRIPLAACTFFAFCVFIFDGITVWVSWTGNEYGCKVVIWIHVLFYLMEKQCLYLFLYDRAKIVHNSLSFTEKINFYMGIFRWILWLTSVFGIPILFYWSAFAAATGDVFSNGECVYNFIYPIVIIICSIADFFLSLGMLSVFVIPLWWHEKNLESIGSPTAHTREQLSSLIRWNILWSTIALAGASISLITLGALMWIAVNDGTSATAHLRFWGLFGITFDSIFGILAVHAMILAWQPKFLRRWLKVRGDGNGSSTQKSKKVGDLAIRMEQEKPVPSPPASESKSKS